MVGTEMDPKRHQNLMMGTEMVIETSVIFYQLIWPIVREDFINMPAVRDTALTRCSEVT
jgi:hypothetical protein